MAALAAVAAAVAVAMVEDGGQSAGDSRDRPPPPPADGEFIRAQGSQTVWVMKAGAKFPMAPDERTAFGYRQDEVREIPREELLEIPDVPRDGVLVRSPRSTIVWAIHDGTRRLSTPPAGVDVTVIPRHGLPQIPPPAGGRRTSVTLDAPVFVIERQPFVLSARLHASAGMQPRGRCVFYRLQGGLTELANKPARAGGCTAHMRGSPSGLRRVRYSVHFIGRRGWRPSQDSTRSIRVMPD